MITEDKVHDIRDVQSLLTFMSEELDWQLPSPASVDELTFEWTGSELNLSEDVTRKLKSGSIKQIQPLREGQPWGIFLIDFATPHLYTTALRQVLRRLVPSRRIQKPNVPAWHCDNLLFICTTGNQEFTFAHFSGEKPERARITTFSWTPQEPVRTLCEFNLPALRYDYSWDDGKWLKEWQRAFDVEKVTNRFFADYTKVFDELQKMLFKQVRGEAGEDVAKGWAHDYALQFLNRLMFIYFIQKKRWLGENPRFTRHFWQAYRDAKQPPDTFFKDWLSVLFFEAFNNQYQNRVEYVKRFPEDIHKALSRAPFLNGGLFSRSQLDTQYTIDMSDYFFELLFEEFEDGPGFFERYNFTISETTPLDQEVAVDPEMIGKVYEKLVNITFEGISEEDLRGGAGIFYTPRVEIDLMCRLSLVDWLINHLGDKYKSVLYQAVFAYDPKEKEEADSRLADENLWSQLAELARSITVLDPACGSGSFLIGMLLVLDDLLARAEHQLGRKQTPFVRRKEIIASSLYGVDVMPWAVHVAELRLWLQLVIETEHQWYELKAEPMLPNLSFKLRPGDSLVQEVGGINFGLHRTHLDISSSLKGKLTQLTGEKLKFYRNDPQAKFKTEAALKQEELSIFREIIDYRVKKLEEDIKSLTRRIETPQVQAVIQGMGPKATQAPLVVQQWREERSKLEEELREVRAAREALRTTQDVPFVWDIAFVEIFRSEKEGFDIVIGNPPYVRQENIEDPQKVYDKAIYKAKLQQSVYAAYPAFFGYNVARNTLARKIDGKSDYYVFFYLHGLKLLNEKGSFCFITSNSWLDVGYGADLQEFLLKHCHIKMILDNGKKRTFASAGINTIIVLFSPPKDIQSNNKATFIMFKAPFEEILSPVIFDEIENAERIGDSQVFELPSARGQTTRVHQLVRSEFRLRQVLQTELLKDDIEFEEYDTGTLGLGQVAYQGNKWGAKYLKMPEFLYPHVERRALVPLGSICELEYGNKPGITDFFILDTEVAEEWGIEGEFLKPVITSTHQIEHLIIATESLEKLIFVNSYSLNTLSRRGYAGATSYVKWGKKQVTRKKGRHTIEDVPWPDVPSVQGNSPEWHCMSIKEPGDFIVPRLIDKRFFFAVNPNKYSDTDMFFHGCFKDRGNVDSGCAVLNSTVTYLLAEIFGRGKGLGGLNLYGPELKALPIPNPDLFRDARRRSLLDAFQVLASREVKNIFVELGLPEPCTSEAHPYCNIISEDLSLGSVLPDRRALDKIVFEALGLTAAEQLEVYQAVVELVKNRLVKAGSV
jgi:type I restriction-modification system DNA methylase subunit